MFLELSTEVFIWQITIYLALSVKNTQSVITEKQGWEKSLGWLYFVIARLKRFNSFPRSCLAAANYSEAFQMKQGTWQMEQQLCQKYVPESPDYHFSSVENTYFTVVNYLCSEYYEEHSGHYSLYF